MRFDDCSDWRYDRVTTRIRLTGQQRFDQVIFLHLSEARSDADEGEDVGTRLYGRSHRS